MLAIFLQTLISISALQTHRALAVENQARGAAPSHRGVTAGEVATLIVHHWDGSMPYLDRGDTNVGAESITPQVQRVKAMSRGSGNRKRFRMAICFHGGALDLSPEVTRFGR